MNNLFFWQNSHRDTKYPYLVLLLMAFFAFCLGLYYYFTGHNALIRWEKVPHLQPVDAFINQFRVGGQDFSIKANGYLLTERYDASLPFINLTAAKIYLALLALCLVFYLTTVSTLKRIPYFAGMFLLMFFLVSCNLDGLGLISETGNFALIGCMVWLAIPSYLFQAFYPNVSFTKRLLAFSLLVGILGSVIFSLSRSSGVVTVLHILNHATAACVVASLLFILWISYEALHGILWVNTQAKTQEGRFGLWQFMLISLLYIGNLLLFFLEEAGIYRFGFVYLDAYIILFLSAIAGFWALRKREELYGRILAFWPAGAYLFLIFATITFLSIGYVFATANDPLVAAYNSFIIYTHLAYGAIFFIYVMINFGRLIGQKLPVYRVVYEPKKLPFYPVYLMGTLLLVVLFLRTNVYTYNQVKAGYFNYLGDLYKTSGEDILAERYFQESDVFEHSNVKANYSLAGISRENNLRNREISYLKEALLLRPNPKVFARLSAQFDEQRYFFEQQYTLKRGLNKFPESPELLTNMGLLYNKTAISDSAAYYYDQAENFSHEKEVIQSNRLALLIKTGLPQQAKILTRKTAETNYLPLQSNKVLLQHLLGKESGKPALPVATHKFSAPEFSLLYHSLLNRLHANDTTAVSRLTAYLKVKENAPYEEDFNLLKAALLHYNGNPVAGKSSMEFLSRNSSVGTGYYQDIIGLWLMENRLYQAAAVYFAEARKNGYTEAPLHESWALALAGEVPEARTALQLATTMETPELLKGARQLQNLLNTTAEQAINLKSPELKLPYIAVQPLQNASDFQALINSIQEPELKAEAQNLAIEKLLQQNNLTEAQSLLSASGFNPKNKPEQLAQRNRLQSLIWVKTGNFAALKQNLQRLYFTANLKHEMAFYQAFLANSENRNNEAKNLFEKVVKTMPYHPEALLAASDFFRDKQKDDFQAYNTLLTGISYNPFSSTLYKAYAFQSLKSGFESYALTAAEKLQALISAEEYLTFNRLFQARLAEHQKAAEGWE